MTIVFIIVGAGLILLMAWGKKMDPRRIEVGMPDRRIDSGPFINMD